MHICPFNVVYVQYVYIHIYIYIYCTLHHSSVRRVVYVQYVCIYMYIYSYIYVYAQIHVYIYESSMCCVSWSVLGRSDLSRQPQVAYGTLCTKCNFVRRMHQTSLAQMGVHESSALLCVVLCEGSAPSCRLGKSQAALFLFEVLSGGTEVWGGHFLRL